MEKSDFGKTISEESAKSLFQLALSVFKKIKTQIVDEIKVEEALKNYSNNYINRHGKVKILGMAEPIPLMDIYTSVRIVSPEYLYKYKEIEQLEDTFRKNRGDFHSGTTVSGIEIANQNEKLNILGAPGSGKSTFLKRIGMLSLIKNHNQFNDEDSVTYIPTSIPVLIELRRFRNETIDLTKVIQKEFEIADFPESRQFVDQALKSGKLLILLDGLDEVPSGVLEEVIEHIKDFTNKFKKNRFICSCRTAFYKTYLKDYTDVEIASFNDSQIRTFIKNWFRNKQDLEARTSQHFTQLLYQDSNVATLELARTPLLLIFLCLTFDESQRFPVNRSSLYRRALLILMEKWAAEKRIHNEDIYQDFNSDLELEMLAELAANFFRENKYFFYCNEVNKGIELFFENTLNLKHIPTSKVLEAIEVQQGLLVQRAPEIYSFSHLTIQEYLTAHYHYSPQKIVALIENHLLEERYREVFLLTAGFSNSDDVIQLMDKKLKQIIQSDIHLTKIINWIDDIIPETEDCETDACRRVFMASLLLGFKRYDSLGFANAFRLETSADKLLRSINPTFAISYILNNTINRKEANRILKLVSAWKNSLDKDSLANEINSMKPEKSLSKMMHGSRQKYRKSILKILYDALDVPESLGELRRNKYDPLVSYLNACALMVDCKNSSLRTSKQTWEYVCRSILSFKERSN